MVSTRWSLARGYGIWVYPPLLTATFSAIYGFWQLFLPSSILALFMIYFHRDPERSPKGDGMLSPADGKVLDVAAGMVKIFMGPFDVHVNRTPLDGVVQNLEYNPGRHSPAFLCARSNERNMIEIQTTSGLMKIYQISGIMVRKIVCYVKPGDSIFRGQRVGMIRFGSRVEVTVPPEYSISVTTGDRVRAGETVIAVRC